MGDTVRTDRIDGVLASTALKAPVRVVATGPVTFVGSAPYGYQTIDGVAVTDNISDPSKFADRVLLVGQADQTQNGIWQVSSLAWTRALDFDGARDAVTGTMVYVNEGTNYKNSTWKLMTANPVVFGTSDIAFELVVASVTQLAGGSTIFFSTTASLMSGIPLSTVIPDGSVALTAGRTVETDKGGGQFYYNASDSSSADNGGTIRVDNAGRRWYFIGIPGAKLFGAKGDGVADDTTALQALLNAVLTSTTVNGSTIFCEVDIEPGTYNITGALSIPDDAWLYRVSGNGCSLVQQTDNAPCLSVAIAASNSNPQNVNFDGFVFKWKNDQPDTATAALGISFTTSKLASDGVTGWWISKFSNLEIGNGYYLMGRSPTATGNAIVWESEFSNFTMAGQTSGGILKFKGGAAIGGSPNNRMVHVYCFSQTSQSPTIDVGTWTNFSVDQWERNQGGRGSVAAPPFIVAITCPNLSVKRGHIESETWTAFAGADSGLIESDSDNTVVDQLELYDVTVDAGVGNFLSLFRCIASGGTPKSIISGIYVEDSSGSEPITFTSGTLVVAQSAGPGRIRLRPPFGIPQDSAYAEKFNDCDSGTLPYIEYDDLQFLAFYGASIPTSATTALVTGPVSSVSYNMPCAGRLVGIKVVLSADLAAGTMAFYPKINSNQIGAGAFNATVPSSTNLASGDAYYFNGITSGDSNQFDKGDQIEVDVVTSSATVVDATVLLAFVASH